MIQVLQAFQHPRFAPAVVHVFETRKPGVARRDLAGKSRYDKFVTRLAIGIHEPPAMRFMDGGGRRNRAHVKLERHGSFDAFGESKSGDLLFMAPDALEKCDALLRGDDRSE